MGVYSTKIVHFAYFYAITSGLLASTSSYKLKGAKAPRDVIIIITNSTILNFLSQPHPLGYQQHPVHPVQTTVNSLLDLPYDILAAPVASVTMIPKPIGLITTPSATTPTPSSPIPTSTPNTNVTNSSTTTEDPFQEIVERPQVSEKCQSEKTKKRLNDRNQSCRFYLECQDGKWTQRSCPKAMGFSEKFMDCLWEGVVEGCSTKPTDDIALRSGLGKQHRNRYE